MKAYNTQQEILLVTDTRFTSRQHSEKDADNTRNLSEREQLQDACWNGLVQEKLPEIFFPAEDHVNIYLWQLREANHFLTLEMGEYPNKINRYHSIDPYIFIDLQSRN